MKAGARLVLSLRKFPEPDLDRWWVVNGSWDKERESGVVLVCSPRQADALVGGSLKPEELADIVGSMVYDFVRAVETWCGLKVTFAGTMPPPTAPCAYCGTRDHLTESPAGERCRLRVRDN